MVAIQWMFFVWFSFTNFFLTVAPCRTKAFQRNSKRGSFFTFQKCVSSGTSRRPASDIRLTLLQVSSEHWQATHPPRQSPLSNPSFSSSLRFRNKLAEKIKRNRGWKVKHPVQASLPRCSKFVLHWNLSIKERCGNGGPCSKAGPQKHCPSRQERRVQSKGNFNRWKCRKLTEKAICSRDYAHSRTQDYCFDLFQW